jgi:hypothetical protein
MIDDFPSKLDEAFDETGGPERVWTHPRTPLAGAGLDGDADDSDRRALGRCLSRCHWVG